MVAHSAVRLTQSVAHGNDGPPLLCGCVVLLNAGAVRYVGGLFRTHVQSHWPCAAEEVISLPTALMELDDLDAKGELIHCENEYWRKVRLALIDSICMATVSFLFLKIRLRVVKGGALYADRVKGNLSFVK